MMRLYLPLIAALGLAPAAAATPYSHCKSGETIVFSCSTGSRYLSVCAAGDIQHGYATMQYRYGVKDKPELVYPDTLQPAAKFFTPGQLSFSGGGGAYLQFAKSNHSYTVFSAIGNWGKDGTKKEVAGVAVKSGDKEIANISCRKGTDYVAGELGPEFFTKAGMGEPKNDFDIPDFFTR